MRQITFLCVCLILLTACGNKKDEAQNRLKREYKEEAVLVGTTKLMAGTFNRELLNNGTLKAWKKADLVFRQPGEITDVNVLNGQRVKQGELLTVVDHFKQTTALEKARRNVDKARYNLEDALISAGFTLKDSTNVPENIMRSCLIKSGYATALADLSLSSRNLKETRLHAPFSGLIANCELKQNNQSSQYKTACTLIDDSHFDVEFPVLESEYHLMQNGVAAHIVPFANSNDTFPGTINTINPMVSDNGMITVTARIKNQDGKLIDGMNVQVIVRMPVPKQKIVPKSAVVLRQERKVVFTIKNDTAIWNYVTVKEENSRFASIKTNIKPGTDIVVSGNLNLAHLAPVKVVE